MPERLLHSWRSDLPSGVERPPDSAAGPPVPGGRDTDPPDTARAGQAAITGDPRGADSVVHRAADTVDLRGVDSAGHRVETKVDLRGLDSVDRRVAATADPPGADSVAHQAADMVHLQGVDSADHRAAAPAPADMAHLLPPHLPKSRKRLSRPRAHKLSRLLRVGRRTEVRVHPRVADTRAGVTADIPVVTDRVAMGMVPAATVRVVMDPADMGRAATVPEAMAPVLTALKVMAPKAAAIRVASTR